MQKSIAGILLSLLLAPAWAAERPPQSLLPGLALQNTMPLSVLKHERMPPVTSEKAGGFGGNVRIGQLSYSGDTTGFPALTVSRTADGVCYLSNKNAVIETSHAVITYNCPAADPAHHNLFWNAYLGMVNGGFSPENDALYAADVLTNLFNDWYGIPPYVDSRGLQKPIHFMLHRRLDNAYLGYEDAIFVGDGVDIYYPLTSLTALGYMIGWLFTEQHANLDFYSESGGIKIAFSCMTAMAAEFYATGKNSWQVGGDVAKNGQAIHYLDIPSKNCSGRRPGDYCDIDTLAQYEEGMGPYYTSGLFNRAFYLLATTGGWNTRKAYDVFVRANRYHWRADSSFYLAACDAVTSAAELGFDGKSVMIAFAGVGIDTRDCQPSKV